MTSIPTGNPAGDPGDVSLEVPSAVKWIVRTLEKSGHDTWAVGGAVRDALAGIASGDWDLATHARPGEMQRIFRRTVPIGIAYGTVGVLARDGTLYEVTTFRQDVETTGRHATVRFAETLDEDLSRRDFTINAVAWHPLRRELRDPYEGARDLARGILRTVGKPEERFSEDYLRILRALRFAGSFSLSIDPATWEGIRGGVPELPVLSPERVREELLKILSQALRPSTALGLYAESGALEVLYPELAALGGDGTGQRGGSNAWEDALEVVDHLPPSRPLLRLAALLRECGVPRSLAVMERLRFSNASIEQVAGLVSASTGRLLSLPAEEATPAETRRWLSRIGPDRLPSLVRLSIAGVRALGEGEADASALVRRWKRVRQELRTAPPLTVQDLALDGRDLIRMGLKPGPDFGKILRRLLEVVIEDPSRNEPDLLAGIVREWVAVEKSGKGSEPEAGSEDGPGQRRREEVRKEDRDAEGE